MDWHTFCAVSCWTASTGPQGLGSWWSSRREEGLSGVNLCQPALALALVSVCFLYSCRAAGVEHSVLAARAAREMFSKNIVEIIYNQAWNRSVPCMGWDVTLGDKCKLQFCVFHLWILLLCVLLEYYCQSKMVNWLLSQIKDTFHPSLVYNCSTVSLLCMQAHDWTTNVHDCAGNDTRWMSPWWKNHASICIQVPFCLFLLKRKKIHFPQDFFLFHCFGHWAVIAYVVNGGGATVRGTNHLPKPPAACLQCKVPPWQIAAALTC